MTNRLRQKTKSNIRPCLASFYPFLEDLPNNYDKADLRYRNSIGEFDDYINSVCPLEKEEKSKEQHDHESKLKDLEAAKKELRELEGKLAPLTQDKKKIEQQIDELSREIAKVNKNIARLQNQTNAYQPPSQLSDQDKKWCRFLRDVSTRSKEDAKWRQDQYKSIHDVLNQTKV